MLLFFIEEVIKLFSRIKKIRQALDMTQQEFADRLQIKRGAIANYESGRNQPIDAVVSLICREFNVSENWLRYGEGDMFVEDDVFNLDDFARQHGATAAELEFLKVYFELDKNVRMALVNHFSNKFQIKTSLFDEVPNTASKLEASNAVEKEDENVG